MRFAYYAHYKRLTRNIHIANVNGRDIPDNAPNEGMDSRQMKE